MQPLLNGDRVEHFEQALVALTQRRIAAVVKLMVFEPLVRCDQRVAKVRDRPLSLTLRFVAQFVQCGNRVGERAEIHCTAAPAGEEVPGAEQHRSAVEAQQARCGRAPFAKSGDEPRGFRFE